MLNEGKIVWEIDYENKIATCGYVDVEIDELDAGETIKTFGFQNPNSNRTFVLRIVAMVSVLQEDYKRLEQDARTRTLQNISNGVAEIFEEEEWDKWPTKN